MIKGKSEVRAQTFKELKIDTRDKQTRRKEQNSKEPNWMYRMREI